MVNTLLIIGGVIQTAFGIFHIWLGKMIQQSATLTPADKSLMLAFNIAGTIMIFFFAYVSFFNRQDLKSTRLGKMTMLLVTLFYFSRAIEEFIWKRVGLCAHAYVTLFFTGTNFFNDNS